MTKEGSHGCARAGLGSAFLSTKPHTASQCNHVLPLVLVIPDASARM